MGYRPHPMRTGRRQGTSMLSLITSVHGSTGGDDVRLTGVPRLIRPRFMLVEDPVHGPVADSEPRGGLVDRQPL